RLIPHQCKGCFGQVCNWRGGSHGSEWSWDDGAGDRDTPSLGKRLNWRGANRCDGRIRRCWGGTAGNRRSDMPCESVVGVCGAWIGSKAGVGGDTQGGVVSIWGASSTCTR